MGEATLGLKLQCGSVQRKFPIQGRIQPNVYERQKMIHTFTALLAFWSHGSPQKPQLVKVLQQIRAIWLPSNLVEAPYVFIEIDH